MKKTTFTLIAFFNLVIAYGQLTKTHNLDLLMSSANEIGIFNGNIIVSERGRIIYQKELGFTDFTKSKKLDRKSTMPIGSIAKEFNSAGILFLAEKGKLNLEDKVSKYLTYLPEWATKIQIKHLLQYTSGLPFMISVTDSEYLHKLAKVEKLEFEPGTGYIYSYANIVLQHEIIKKVANQSYEDFLKNIFFKKLKIKGGLIPEDSVLTANMAGSFDNDSKETTFIHGGGEMYFTIKDVYTWVTNLHRDKIVNNNSQLVLSKSFDKNSESSLGYANVENNEITEHYHQGSGNNYEAIIYYTQKENRVIVLMTNSQNFKLGEIKDAIISILDNQPFAIPKKSIYLDIREKLFNNFQNGMMFYEQIKANRREKYDFPNELYDLIRTGKYLMRRDRFEDAIKVFEISTTVDAKNTGGISNAFSLIGECYDKLKNTPLAIINLKKALEFDPNNKNAEGLLKRIENK